jgi:hypothetical protein
MLTSKSVKDCRLSATDPVVCRAKTRTGVSSGEVDLADVHVTSPSEIRRIRQREGYAPKVVPAKPVKRLKARKAAAKIASQKAQEAHHWATIERRRKILPTEVLTIGRQGVR